MHGLIQVIQPQNEKSITVDKPFANLNIRSRISAVVLNNVVVSIFNSCSNKVGWNSRQSFALKGGGFIVKGDARVTINDLHEIGISYFAGKYSLNNYIKDIYNEDTNTINTVELTRKTKTRLAKGLKDLWEYRSMTDEKTKEKYMFFLISEFGELSSSNFNERKFVIPIPSNYPYDPIIKFTEDHFKILYDYLRGKNRYLLVNKYGEKKVSAILGKPLDDQFVRSAIDVIKNEISQTMSNFLSNKGKTMDDENAEIDRVKTKYEQLRTKMYDEYLEKVQNLRNEMIEVAGISSDSLQLKGEMVTIDEK